MGEFIREDNDCWDSECKAGKVPEATVCWDETGVRGNWRAQAKSIELGATAAKKECYMDPGRGRGGRCG